MKIEANPINIYRAFSTISYRTRRPIHSISWPASNHKDQNKIGKGIIRLGDELKHGSDLGAMGRVSVGKSGKAAGPLGRWHGPQRGCMCGRGGGNQLGQRWVSAHTAKRKRKSLSN
jgi:hypothetical protein